MDISNFQLVLIQIDHMFSEPAQMPPPPRQSCFSSSGGFPEHLPRLASKAIAPRLQSVFLRRSLQLIWT